jgi:hypothetical protein
MGAFAMLILVAVLTPGVYPLLLEPIANASQDDALARSPMSAGEAHATRTAGEGTQRQDADQRRLTGFPELGRLADVADALLPGTAQPDVMTHLNAELSIPSAVFTTGTAVQIRWEPLELKRADCLYADSQLAKLSHDNYAGEAVASTKITDELFANGHQHQSGLCDLERRVPLPVARPMLPQPRAAIARTLGTGKGPNTKKAAPLAGGTASP